MAFFSRNRAAADRLTAQNLADFGRWKFLGERSGVAPGGVYNLVSPLNELVFTRNPVDRARAIAELRRHAARGIWETVGAWKYVREFLDTAPDTQELIDGGLLALHRMRITNLRIHLAPIDTPRYVELTGGPVPHDGFFGPPVFDSEYGPTRQYYFDQAIATAAARMPVRVPSARGVEPGDLADAARAMWDFGLLVHRGPLVVPPDISFEPNVLRVPLAVAANVDHDRFAELVAELVLDRSTYLYGTWSALGGARFIEEFLDPAMVRGPAYARLLDEGLELLLRDGDLDVSFPAEILTPRTRERLRQLRAASQ